MHTSLHLTMIFSAKPLPITREDPFTITSIGPLNGADFCLIILVPGTIPKLARRLFAFDPAFTLTTTTTLPLSHSVRHFRSVATVELLE